jgi:hypothetical protein
MIQIVFFIDAYQVKRINSEIGLHGSLLISISWDNVGFDEYLFVLSGFEDYAN